jgi:CheY-like chemotaxis protein
VEDHEDTLRVMATLLRRYGYDVRTAGTVHRALELAEHEHFDLLISDLGLPDGSGLDVMREVKSHYRMKGIALSGFGMEEDLRRSMDAGFEQHLTKPVNIQALENLIRRVAS